MAASAFRSAQKASQTPLKSAIEQETKLSVDENFRWPVLRGKLLPRRVLTSTYYDTPNYRLTHASITLRHRIEHGKGVWQLKLPMGEARREIETAGESELKSKIERLEEGGLFKQFNIVNFLEGDFFGWYLDCWDEPIDTPLREIVRRLSGYSFVTLDIDPDGTRDLLKKLYQNLMPKELRHHVVPIRQFRRRESEGFRNGAPWARHYRDSMRDRKQAKRACGPLGALPLGGGSSRTIYSMSNNKTFYRSRLSL